MEHKNQPGNYEKRNPHDRKGKDLNYYRIEYQSSAS